MTDLIQRKRRDRVLQFRLVAGEMNVLRLETVRALKAAQRLRDTPAEEAVPESKVAETVSATTRR